MLFLKTFKDAKFAVDGNAFQTFISLSTKNFCCVDVVSEGHPRFCSQLSAGLDAVCLAGEWLTATTNTNM